MPGEHVLRSQNLAGGQVRRQFGRAEDGLDNAFAQTRPHEVHLQKGEALIHPLLELRAGDGRVRRHLGVGIDADLVAELAAE
jgi:hypothetical protein